MNLHCQWIFLTRQTKSDYSKNLYSSHNHYFTADSNTIIHLYYFITQNSILYHTESGSKNISFVFNYRLDENEVKVEKAEEVENTEVLKTQPIIASPLSSSISVNKRICKFCNYNIHIFVNCILNSSTSSTSFYCYRFLSRFSNSLPLSLLPCLPSSLTHTFPFSDPFSYPPSLFCLPSSYNSATFHFSNQQICIVVDPLTLAGQRSAGLISLIRTHLRLPLTVVLIPIPTVSDYPLQNFYRNVLLPQESIRCVLRLILILHRTFIMNYSKLGGVYCGSSPHIQHKPYSFPLHTK